MFLTSEASGDNHANGLVGAIAVVIILYFLIKGAMKK